GLQNVLAITCGQGGTLALTPDGRITAWGFANPGPSSLDNVVATAAGTEHWLALRSDRTVVGWGRSDNGEIDVPANLTDVIAIDANGDDEGPGHNLAL